MQEFSLYSSVRSEYVLKFATREHSIDAAILANALLSFRKNVLSAAKFISGVGSANLLVEAIEPGSVEVRLAVDAQRQDENDDVIPKILNVVSEVKDIYSLLDAKPLTGAKFVGEANVEIENVDGVKKSFSRASYLTFQDCRTPPFGDCSSYRESSMDSISLIDQMDDVEVLHVNAGEFKSMSTDALRTDNIEDRESVMNCRVRIATIPLDAPKNAWQFIVQGERISAKILDEVFIAKIEQHQQSFEKGDELQVQLKITKKIDSITGHETSCRYFVLSVVDVLRQAQPMDLPGISGKGEFE